MNKMKKVVAFLFVAGLVISASAQAEPSAADVASPSTSYDHTTATKEPGAQVERRATAMGSADRPMRGIVAELRQNAEFVAKVEAAKSRLAADPELRARVEARWPKGKPRPL